MLFVFAEDIQLGQETNKPMDELREQTAELPEPTDELPKQTNELPEQTDELTDQTDELTGLLPVNPKGESMMVYIHLMLTDWSP